MGLMGDVVKIRDYHLKRMERDAAKVLGEVLPLVEFAKTGGPIVAGSDPWAGRHYPGGIDDLPLGEPA